ncbi:glycosyltransferase family 2 protein [Arenimonas sp.]|uniref:glycosyltransferase family 2 protein n=1 Tax=Arenimonas sp. TaxID=1872635 RepID=UPI0039E5C15D
MSAQVDHIRDFQPIVVIPVFNHGEAIGHMVDGVLAQAQSCLLVDDGSEAGCAQVLDRLHAAHPDRVFLLRLEQNQGKGGAVMAGLREALRRGYSHAVQIDADGQHDPNDIPGFLGDAAAHPDCVVVGRPLYDESVPKGRLYGRYATHIWVWINTLSLQIRDSMCGFRVYPLAPTVALIDQVRIGRRMDFDSEVLVRLHWRGVPMINRATRVTYPLDGVSHFDVLRDNLRISRMHAKLFFGMLLRLPLLLWRKAMPA